MAFKFNPTTGKLDLTGTSDFPNGITLTDSNGVKWQVTVDTTGQLVTTQIVVTNSGIPIGAGDYLFITYA